MYINDVWWTMSPATPSYSTSSSTYVLNVDSATDFATISSYGVRPVVTLSSKVKITSGDGSSSSPYELSL